MKYKIKAKQHILNIKIKTGLKEKIDFVKAKEFQGKKLRNFFKINEVNKNSIVFIGPVGISLRKRMKKPISVHDFFLIIEQIVNVVQIININDININSVGFNMDNIFINEVTKELNFLYMPLENASINVNLVELTENIIYSVIPLQQEDSEAISEFTYYFKDLQRFDINLIEKYILKVDKNAVRTIKRISNIQSNQHINKHKEHDSTEKLEDGLTENDVTDELENDLNGNDVTEIFSENDDYTELLQEDNTCHYATLFRIITNETIQINKPVFRIGKEKSYSDYFVANNNKVSRGHADIIKRGNRFFVMDLNSQNGTYINNKLIPVQKEIEIYDGNYLKLANEEFVFHI